MNATTTIAALHLKQVSASTCKTRLRSLAHPMRRGRTAWPPKNVDSVKQMSREKPVFDPSLFGDPLAYKTELD